MSNERDHVVWIHIAIMWSSMVLPAFPFHIVWLVAMAPAFGLFIAAFIAILRERSTKLKPARREISWTKRIVLGTFQIAFGAACTAAVRFAMDHACSSDGNVAATWMIASSAYFMSAWCACSATRDAPGFPRVGYTLILPVIISWVMSGRPPAELRDFAHCVLEHPPHDEQPFEQWSELHSVGTNSPLLVLRTGRYDEPLEPGEAAFAKDVADIHGLQFDRGVRARVLGRELIVIGRCSVAELASLPVPTLLAHHTFVVQDHGDVVDAPLCPKLAPGWREVDQPAHVLASDQGEIELPDFPHGSRPWRARGAFISATHEYSTQQLLVCRHQRAHLLTPGSDAVLSLPWLGCDDRDVELSFETRTVIPLPLEPHPERLRCNAADFAMIGSLYVRNVKTTRLARGTAKKGECAKLKEVWSFTRVDEVQTKHGLLALAIYQDGLWGQRGYSWQLTPVLLGKNGEELYARSFGSPAGFAYINSVRPVKDGFELKAHFFHSLVTPEEDGVPDRDAHVDRVATMWLRATKDKSVKITNDAH